MGERTLLALAPRYGVAAVAIKESRASRRGRRWASRAATIAACLTFALSVPVLWAHQTLLTTDGYVRLVGSLPSDPEFSTAVGDAAARAIVTRLQVEDRLKDSLPAAAAPLVTAATMAVQDRLGEALGDALASPRFSEIWVAANTTLHRETLGLMRGTGGGAVSLEDNVVSLDLTALIAGGFRSLQENGVIPADLSLPDGSAASDSVFVNQVLDALRERGWPIAQDLGERLGAIPLFEAPRLGALQQLVDLFDAVALILPLLAIGLTILALSLSRRPWRTLIAIAATGAVTAGLLLVLVAILGRVPIATPHPEGAIIIGSIEEAVTGSLRRWAFGTLIITGAMFVGAWLLRRRERRQAAQGVSAPAS